VRNQALNSIGNTGHGTASTGSAVSTSAETMIPLSAVTHVGVAERSARREIERYRGRDCQPLVVDGERYIAGAVQAINAAMVRLGLPTSVHGTFQGTARAFQESVANEPYLILAALIAVCRSHPCCTAGSRWCGREATGPPCIFRRPEHRSQIPQQACTCRHIGAYARSRRTDREDGNVIKVRNQMTASCRGSIAIVVAPH
jgi:hypothetical protein